MENYSIHLPSYSIGTDILKKVPEICLPFGKTAVAIGGEKAMASIRERLLEAVEGSELSILDFVRYGEEASYETVERLKAVPVIQDAELLFAIGGGKATDTVKALATQMGKPVFAFPTIGSNCSACTSVSIMYHEDGSFLAPFFLPAPPVHTFICTPVIAASPSRYLWAGMGDTYAKYYESTISSRGEDLPHYTMLGVQTSVMCMEPILKYGKKALDDQNAGIASYEFEQVLLAVIVTTAIASILLTAERIIDYNTGLAHAIFYALTSYPEIEKNHLHGELVSFGVLVLLLLDGRMDWFEKVYNFNKSVGLPTCLEDVDVKESDLPEIIERTLAMKDIDHNPYKITTSMLEAAFEELILYLKPMRWRPRNTT